jgi:hypothetical protein
MSRCSWHRRLVVSAVLLGLVTTLPASPAQALENSPSGWLDAVAHTLAPWTPAVRG